MAWAAPVIHAVGDVLSAADWNITSNDLTFLSSVAGDRVDAAQTTASAAYVNLATAGPAFTVTTGASALVSVSAHMFNSGLNASLMGVAVSGATTIAPADQDTARFDGTVGTGASTQWRLTGLTAGSNTFTAKYRTTGGVATFESRKITVVPLP